MLNKLLIALGLSIDIGDPVHVGCNPVYFTYVYESDTHWIFSWHTTDHSLGSMSVYHSQECAETARDYFEASKKCHEHASFVRP